VTEHFPDLRRIALYARVSTARQAEADLSIPDQIKQGQEYCERHGWKIVATFVEPGVSATDDRRPEFLRMIDMATAPDEPVDIILVHSLSRFSRDQFIAESYIRVLRKAGVEVVSITQDFSRDNSGEMVRKIFSMFDEYSSRENAKHTHRAMRENAKQGFWNGSAPPLGYKTVEAERRGPKIKKVLAIDEDTAPIVRRIFDLYLGVEGSSHGVKSIAARLNAEGVTIRGKKFSVSNVHDILKRETYAGTHYFDQRDSRTERTKDRSEWIAVPVPPIITRERFDLVQATLAARNSKNTPPRVVNGPTLLTGLARCDTCGSGMILSTGKSGRYRYYACAGCALKGKSVCQGRRLPCDALDQLVVDYLADRLFTPQRVEALLSDFLVQTAEADGKRRERLRRARAQLTELEGSITRLLRVIETGAMEPDDPQFREQMVALRSKRDAKNQEIKLLEQEAPNRRPVITPEKVQRFTAALREALTTGDGRFRRDYLRLFVDKIIVADNEIRIRGTTAAIARAAAHGGLPRTDQLVPSLVREWRALVDSNHRPTA
jgi:site-specific DNA recombinase